MSHVQALASDEAAARTRFAAELPTIKASLAAHAALLKENRKRQRRTLRAMERAQRAGDEPTLEKLSGDYAWLVIEEGQIADNATLIRRSLAVVQNGFAVLDAMAAEGDER